MILDLDHINIATDKLAETRTFFIEVLGLVERWRPDFDFPGHWLYVGDKPVVHLVARGEPGAAGDAVALNHIAFAISDLEAFTARLSAQGVRFAQIEVPNSPIQQIFLRDPNGVIIELNYLGARTARERSETTST